MIQPPLTSTLFLYTTLFRSRYARETNHPASARGRAAGQSAHHAGGRIRARRDRTCPQRQTRCAFRDRKSTRLNSSHLGISYAVFCLKKKKLMITRKELRIDR